MRCATALNLSYRCLNENKTTPRREPQPLTLLRPRRERPRSRAAEQRDERASFQLIELHSIPASQGLDTGYRVGGE
jgi:hypothetical protein